MEQIEALLAVIRERRSVRSYLSQPVPQEYIDKVIEAGRWAPSGINTQPWDFIVVTREDLRQRMVALFQEGAKRSHERDPDFPAANLSYLKDIPVFIVVCGDPRFRPAYPKDAPRGLIYIQSVAAAIQNMFLAASALNLGTTWLTVRPMVEKGLKQLLDIPADLQIMAVLPLGYPAKAGKSWRKSPQEFVHYEVFDRSKYTKSEDIPELIKFYRERRQKAREEYEATP